MAEAELTEEEIETENKKIWDETQQEVFEGKDPVVDLIPEKEVEQTLETEKDLETDPLAGLPPALMEQLSGINERLGALATIENRVKQTESRIGSMANAAHQEKLAAEKAEKEKPTEAELAAALESDETWTSFEKEFPDMAKAIGLKRAEDTKELGNLRAKLEALEAVKPATPAPPVNIEKRLVGAVHPGWVKDINTPEFGQWLGKQTIGMKAKMSSNSAEDAIYVLTEFKKAAAPSGKTPQEIAAEKDQRLAASVTTTNNHKTKRPKAEADMSDEEFWKATEKEIWKK